MQAPTKYELVINLETAASSSQTLIGRADKRREFVRLPDLTAQQPFDTGKRILGNLNP